MQARITNPATVLPDISQAVKILHRTAFSTGLDPAVLELAHLRASQINNCGVCVDFGARGLRKNGESDERLYAVAAWRETPYFTAGERAALALTEYATRMADQSDAVPDAIWDEAAKHFDERELAALVLWIATTNFFNRLNVTTRQLAPQNFD